MTCWVLVLLLAIVAWIFWQQLIKWRNWKLEMKAWIADYQAWIAEHCTCDQPDPPPPPPPPDWPNGGWP